MHSIMRRSAVVACACALVPSCGGGGGGGSSPPPPPQMFSVGGAVSGLEAVGLVLQNNGGPDLAISANGSFSFPAQVAGGGAYAVTIKSQPTVGPAQLCSVTNGAGTVASAVTNVAIACVTRTFKFLYVTSVAAHEVRGYSINPVNGSLAALLGPPVVTPSEPIPPVPDPTGKFVFVTTRGDFFVEPPRLGVYAVNPISGALTEVASYPYFSITVATPGASVVLPPSIHPSGAIGYLPVLFPPTSIFGVTIDTATGQPAEIPGMPLNLPFGVSGMAFDSAGRSLFVAVNAGNPYGEIQSFSVDIPSGVLTQIGTFSTLGQTPLTPFLTPDGRHLLATNNNSGTLMVFAVVGATLTPLTDPPIPTGPAGSKSSGIALNQRTNIFYTTSIETPNVQGGPTSVVAFRFDAATGGVTPVGAPVSANRATSGAFLHPSGRFLFQYNASIASIQRFTLDPTTGVPAMAPDLTAIPGATRVIMTLDASGRFLYLTNESAATVSSYSIDAGTGALTLINTEAAGAGALYTLPFLLE